MQGISRRRFAKLDGCSEKLVRNGLEKGHLVAFPDGSISPELVGTPWRQRADKGADAGAYPADNRRPEDLSFAEAQRIKEIYLGKLRRLEYEVKSGRLVDVAAVDSEVFNLARQHRDALQNWPARTAPLVAAEFQIDPVKLQLSLDRHVRQFLVERSTPELRLKQTGWLRGKQAGA